MQLTVVNHAFVGGDAANKLAEQLIDDAGLKKPGPSPFEQLIARAKHQRQ